jgi:hypothetical protein
MTVTLEVAIKRRFSKPLMLTAAQVLVASWVAVT